MGEDCHDSNNAPFHNIDDYVKRFVDRPYTMGYYIPIDPLAFIDMAVPYLYSAAYSPHELN